MTVYRPLDLQKAKRAAIGATSADGKKKKVAEGKWEPIKGGEKTTTKESKPAFSEAGRKNIAAIAKEFGKTDAEVTKVVTDYKKKYPRRAVNIDTIRGILASETAASSKTSIDSLTKQIAEMEAQIKALRGK